MTFLFDENDIRGTMDLDNNMNNYSEEFRDILSMNCNISIGIVNQVVNDYYNYAMDY